jgi:hypothetical protein
VRVRAVKPVAELPPLGRVDVELAQLVRGEPASPVTSTLTPVSSSVSRTAHWETVSPSSCFPIGIAHWPVSRRCCSSSRPTSSTARTPARGQCEGAVERYPAHDLRREVLPRLVPGLPHSRVRVVPGCRRAVGQRDQKVADGRIQLAELVAELVSGIPGPRRARRAAPGARPHCRPGPAGCPRTREVVKLVLGEHAFTFGAVHERAKCSPSRLGVLAQALSMSRASDRAVVRLVTSSLKTSRSARPSSSSRASRACARVCCSARSPAGWRAAS